MLVIAYTASIRSTRPHYTVAYNLLAREKISTLTLDSFSTIFIVSIYVTPLFPCTDRCLENFQLIRKQVSHQLVYNCDYLV